MRHAAVLLALAPNAGALLAQSYPVKPVRLVVPYPPGGGTDIIGRILAQKLTESLGQQVVVENRGGAGGTIGTEIAAKAPPDGYLILMAPTSHVINPSIYAKLPYDTVKDFAPITLAASASILLAVHPSVPARSIAELIALAKTRPGEINFASAGNGTVFHLTGELFKRQAGISMNHVPFKGGGPAVTALVAGQVTVAFETILTLHQFVQSAKVRPLAVSSVQRSTALPQVPTTVELGFKSIVADNWYGFYAPAGTSKDIIGKLNTDLVRILRTAEVRERFKALGTEIVAGTPEQLADYVRSELAKWGKTARDAGAHID